jgi:hypothetical protein
MGLANYVVGKNKIAQIFQRKSTRSVGKIIFWMSPAKDRKRGFNLCMIWVACFVDGLGKFDIIKQLCKTLKLFTQSI